MSNIALYNPSDTTVANRVTNYLRSVNTPDYTSNPNALINPDLTNVSGVDQKFWKVVSDSTVVEMDGTDKSALLPADKTSQSLLLRRESETYVDNKYPERVELNAQYLDSLEKGFADRVDYIQPWRDWIGGVKNYAKDKEQSISDSTSYEELNSVSWDFSAEFDASDPQITLRQALELVGDSVSGLFEGYMQRTDATTLTLHRYNGRNVMVNRELLHIPEDGVKLVSSDNLITSTGGNAGVSMSANTLYYVYGSNGQANLWPKQMRASTTAPSMINGVKYLGTSGNAKNWRFIGWVYPTNTGFKDDETARLVVNQYNRRRLYGFLNPGYNDNASVTTANFTNLAFAPIGGNAGKFEFLGTGEDSIEYEFNALLSASSGERAFIGVGYDSDNNAATAMGTPEGADTIEITTGRAFIPPVGYHYFQALACVTGGTGTVYIDSPRRGSASDPSASFFAVIIFG